MASSIDGDFVLAAVSEAIVLKIQKEIEAIVLESVLPKVKQIAEDSAKQICTKMAIRQGFDFRTSDLQISVVFQEPK